jgi:ATP-binding protein involved in chromosome partitioning
MVSRDAVLAALAQVVDPELKRPVTELDMVRGIEIDGGRVAVTIALTVAGCPLRHSFEQQVDDALLPLEGVESVELAFDVMSPEEKTALVTRLRGGVERRGISLDPATRVIAIASGKGGVGKSSLTANLAAAFDAVGDRVGILDADVYGHSIPHMLGVHQRPVVVDKMIVPPVRGDLKLMSIGFFLDDNAPVMWRGPMLHRALEQFLSDVHWGELDTLLVDMPPGTGDVAISLGQLLPRAEVLVVTTPQPAAQQVAVRAADMAQKTGMRLLGVAENMSYLVGTGQEVFGSGGGQALAEALGVPLLGSVPLDPALREAADAGEMLVERDPEAEASRAIRALADRVRSARRGAIVRALPLVS